MKTAKAHRKFAIYSNFLDTILEGEEEVREGETRKDTLKRILKELEETAAELRKEAAPSQQETQLQGLAWAKTQPEYFQQSHIPTISKDFEKLEIAIDNCTTLEELQVLKDKSWASGLSQPYIVKFNELNNGRPTDFATGLE